MKVVCVGDCCVDRYMPDKRDLLGGITANFARHAASAFPASDKLCIVSPIGTDRLAGEIIRPGLERCGIDLHLKEIDGASPIQLIEIQPGGEKHFVRYDEGVLGKFRIDDTNVGYLVDAELVVTQVFRQIRETFASIVSTPISGTLAVDFADFAEHPDFVLLERCIERIDVAFFGLSADDTAIITRIEDLARRSGKLLVVTLAAQGSAAFTGDERIDAPALPVEEIVDTTGAGDAFAAGYLSRYTHGAAIAESLQAGAQLACRTIQHLGAWDQSRG